MLRHIWTNATFRTRLEHSIKRRTDAGRAKMRTSLARVASLTHPISGAKSAEPQSTGLSQASPRRVSDTGLRQLHHAEVCTLSGRGKSRTLYSPLQTIIRLLRVLIPACPTASLTGYLPRTAMSCGSGRQSGLLCSA
jgi:hypothetical protein